VATAEAAFERLRTPALFLAMPAALALYAAGRTTGVALDCGGGLSHAAPVVDGWVAPAAVQRLDVGGVAVTHAFRAALRGAGVVLNSSAEVEVAREAKERVCRVARNPAAEEAAAAAATGPGDTPLTLPDGTCVPLRAEPFRAPEVLFQPALAGLEGPPGGVAALAAAALGAAELEARRALAENVVLAGGSTLLPGFGVRCLAELRAASPVGMRLRIAAPPERATAVWTGGSVLASLGSFRDLWVTRAQYEEEGAAAVLRGVL
jgi:centractin